MRRTSFAKWPCSIARTMDLLGDWWTPLVLREACYGIRKFDDFQRELGIARNTLNVRLRRLVAEGLVEVVCASCGAPLRAQDTTMRMGPGYPDRLKTRPDIQRRFAARAAKLPPCHWP